MSLLEFLGFRPTLPRFAARVLRALPEDEATGWTFNAERECLQHPGGTEISLRNLFLEYCASGVFGRPALVRKYADLALTRSHEIPALWVAAVKNIYPVVRSEFVETTIEIKCRATGATMDSVVLPFAGDLRIRLVYDFGNFVRYVKGEDLGTWGQSAPDVLGHALANLGRLEKPTWVDSGLGFFSLASPMSYGESMLQLDSAVAALPFAPNAVFMPCNRGILLAADGRSEEAMTAMLTEAARCLREEPWPVSATLCKRSPDGWQQVDPPACAAALAHNLFVQHRADYYAGQKEELDALHESRGEDVFVANCSLLGNEDTWQSYCVWTQDVKSLLPVTDWIALMPQGEDVKFIRVAWQDVVETCGPRMLATTESPPRFLVDSFPTPDEWSALSSRAITG
ncbi:MAG: hypothetical protein WC213_02035 [Arenimonas sp.]|jgi:hypothetical protein